MILVKHRNKGEKNQKDNDNKVPDSHQFLSRSVTATKKNSLYNIFCKMKSFKLMFIYQDMKIIDGLSKYIDFMLNSSHDLKSMHIMLIRNACCSQIKSY